ncbi:sigma-70 family RNA polymerase sigma factor [Vibrio breoganii]|nr:sigma-70 family RNA polymerase sigma factor [Vibrio breoganii]
MGDYVQTEDLSRKECEAIEARVLDENSNLVRSLLKPYRYALDEGTLEDLTQVAFMAMVIELRKFSHVDSVEFKKSATVRMRGEIIDELRRRDFAERNLRTLSNSVKKAEGVLRQRLGREPNESEVCAALAISIDDYREAKSLEMIAMDIEFDERVSATDSVEDEQKEFVADALSRLDDRSQKMIYLLYVGGLGLEEVALVMGTSRATVARVKELAISKIKHLLGE